MHDELQSKEDKTQLIFKLVKDRWPGVIEARQVKELAHQLGQLLLLPPKRHELLQPLLMRYIGQELTNERLHKLVRRCVFGLDALQRGLPLGEEHFVPQQVKLLCRHVTVRPDGADLHIEILNGQLATAKRLLRFPEEIVQYIIERVGMRSSKKEPRHPRELTQAQMTGPLQRDLKGFIRLSRCTATPRQRSRNSSLRRRRDKQACGPCFACPKTTAECPLSCHQEVWHKKLCEQGHEAWFEGDQCLVCLEEKRREFVDAVWTR